VARKKPKKKNSRRRLAIFVLTPLAVWLLALAVWFFWYDITRMAAPGKTVARPGGSSSQNNEGNKNRGQQPAKSARENIPEQDRKALDDLLKRR
jgi:hypothetical protein